MNFWNNGKTKLKIEIDEKVYNYFARLIKEKGDNTLDEAIEQLMRDYVANAEKVNTLETGSKRQESYINYYAKAYDRIPNWANKPYQYNSIIVWSYFRAEQINGRATIDLMKGLCIDRGMNEHQFKINYASMKLDSSNSHGKIFEDDGENVWIWEKIKPRLMQYKNNFCKEDNKW